jgi:hypothetical protein
MGEIRNSRRINGNWKRSLSYCLVTVIEAKKIILDSGNLPYLSLFSVPSPQLCISSLAGRWNPFVRTFSSFTRCSAIFNRDNLCRYMSQLPNTCSTILRLQIHCGEHLNCSGINKTNNLLSTTCRTWAYSGTLPTCQSN